MALIPAWLSGERTTDVVKEDNSRQRPCDNPDKSNILSLAQPLRSAHRYPGVGAHRSLAHEAFIPMFPAGGDALSRS
jgi:hypothetical protein